MIRYRTAESVKRKIDAMLKKGEVILDHGVGAYEFAYYDYVYPCVQNGFVSQLHLFYKDFDGKIKYYMTVSEANLRIPVKDDYGIGLITCSWDKRWPTLLEVRDYTVW